MRTTWVKGSENAESGSHVIEDTLSTAIQLAHFSSDRTSVTRNEQESEQGKAGAEKKANEEGTSQTQLRVREAPRSPTSVTIPQSTVGEPDHPKETRPANGSHGEYFKYGDENDVEHPFHWTCRRYSGYLRR